MEICIDNQYGTICDDKWDDRDAAVVCAQLGFSRTSKYCIILHTPERIIT